MLFLPKSFLFPNLFSDFQFLLFVWKLQCLFCQCKYFLVQLLLVFLFLPVIRQSANINKFDHKLLINFYKKKIINYFQREPFKIKKMVKGWTLSHLGGRGPWALGSWNNVPIFTVYYFKASQPICFVSNNNHPH